MINQFNIKNNTNKDYYDFKKKSTQRLIEALKNSNEKLTDDLQISSNKDSPHVIKTIELLGIRNGAKYGVIICERLFEKVFEWLGVDMKWR